MKNASVLVREHFRGGTAVGSSAKGWGTSGVPHWTDRMTAVKQ